MIFNSLIFIFGFFPISIILYNVIPNDKIKNLVLLLLSLLFYSWSDPVTLVVLILSIFWNYFSGIEIFNEKNNKARKREFIISVIVNVLILVIYKYLDFLLPIDIETLDVPMGLSFFTFTSISYLADVYMHKADPQKNILAFALFIAFFGKLSMGPITQYHQMQDQLLNRKVTKDDLSVGMQLFMKGLIKKVLLADNFALVFSSLSTSNSVLGAWLYSLSYMFEIYFDFSGYSDMAIGISRIFGFKIDPNFDHPYIAISVQDFWRRWHISLSRWFRDYIYIPLGGSRVNNQLYIRNIFVVWLCTGIWHGANWTFITWGLYFALFLLLEKFFLREKLVKLPKFIQHLYALIVILIGWVIFFSPSLGACFTTLGKMFGIGAGSLVDKTFLFQFKNHFILFVLGILFSTEIYHYLELIIFNRFKNNAVWIHIIVYVLMFVICVVFILGSTYQSFLYAAF